MTSSRSSRRRPGSRSATCSTARSAAPRIPISRTELAHVGLELRGRGRSRRRSPMARTRCGSAPRVAGTQVTGVLDQLAGAGRRALAGRRARRDRRVPGRPRTASCAPARRRARRATRSQIAAFRRHRLIQLAAVLAVAPPTRWEIAGVAEPGAAAARYQAWLGEPHPGAQSVATVTTTARWV